MSNIIEQIDQIKQSVTEYLQSATFLHSQFMKYQDNSVADSDQQVESIALNAVQLEQNLINLITNQIEE